MVNIRELNPDESLSASFGAELRSSREGAGMTQTELARMTSYSNAHVSAVETGRKLPTLRFSRAVDKVLGTGSKFERLCRTVRNDALLEGFPEYVTFEGRAREIRLFENGGIVPGLLQTHEYATALARGEAERGSITFEQGGERVAFLAERQTTLARTPAPMVHVVMDESCLLREVGGPKVMRAQLDSLLDFAALPHTTLQITPFSSGERRAFNLPVRLLTLPNRTMVGYAESQFQGHLERDVRFVDTVLGAFHQLQSVALSHTASVAMIQQLRKVTP
ncbi:helix-turn-helix transcriptional regulator [Streptomyces sp. NBC_00102]|uniref:helix-turn-helix domain-containing protein n=1 Tax=Streptomyces sp. NBC_00102 TaxID=2975652 RepID=UPI002250F7B6|nr:helix-turn-helix transcriptional regulator [Streptomyces sp. NBC_00102]MCX5397808.1 helix-turn-helix transcriptional regulator [Streptomyces sp. NBC_00102]